MTVRLPWFSTRQSFRLLTVSLGLLLASFGLLWVFNLWQYQNLPTAGGEYLPSTLDWVEVPQSAKVGQRVKVVWSISAPTPRKVERTALFWSEESSPSARLADPQQAPYPFRSPDYWQGPFGLPAQFEVTLVPTTEVPLYLRLYARVDGQDIWSQERKLSIHP